MHNLTFKYPDSGHKLFDRDDSKVSEWDFCEGHCAPTRVLGCYVTISCKLKGIRANNEPVRSEQRKVNQNCEELDCP